MENIQGQQLEVILFPFHGKHFSTANLVAEFQTHVIHQVEEILWAVGGLVLTAGALHLRRRTLFKNSAAAVVLRNNQMQEEARARQQAMYKASSATSAGAAKREKKTRDSPKAA